MNDPLEFQDLFITCDTREQSNTKKTRLEKINCLWKEKGGQFNVIEQKNDHCDYKITGTFREQEINLGIEYKTITDFTGSFTDLSWKLFDAHKEYNNVALFIQENCISLTYNKETPYVKIPEVSDGSADILNYWGYFNFLQSLALDGILTRQFNHENQFIEALYSCLIYCSKRDHTGLALTAKTFEAQYLNVLCKIPGIGAKGAWNIYKIYPTFADLMASSLEEKTTKLGSLNAKKLTSFLYFGKTPEPPKPQTPKSEINVLIDKIAHMVIASGKVGLADTTIMEEMKRYGHQIPDIHRALKSKQFVKEDKLICLRPIVRADIDMDIGV